MTKFTYAELQMMRSQGYDESRRLGYSTIDVPAVEREIAKRDKAARAA